MRKKRRPVLDFVRRRDKICQKCRTHGSRGNPLTVHHILPKCRYPKLVNDPENMTLLCRRCHDKVHGIHRGKIKKAKGNRYWEREMRG